MIRMKNLRHILLLATAITAITTASVSAGEITFVNNDSLIYSNNTEGCALSIPTYSVLYGISETNQDTLDLNSQIKNLEQCIRDNVKQITTEVNDKVQQLLASAISSTNGIQFNKAPIVTETVVETTTEATTEAATETATEATTAEVTTTVATETTTELTTKATDEIANEILEITNNIRVQNGLSALTLDKDLTAAAAYHAKDMYDNNYFDHTSKDGTDFYTRIRRFTTSYTTLGENIAKGNMTAEEVMDLWMNSEGHRANILNADYKHVGIAQYNGCYFVVDFAN
jgi:uncharacterized protein YkwD